MSRTKKVMLAIVLALVIIQFIRPVPNTDNGSVNKQYDIIAAFNVPANVAGNLKTSCYDCHSNSTRYPWYAQIQPFGWLLARHVSDGKKDLNFSEFTSYSKRRQLSKLKAVHNSIKDGSMPLSSYTLLHEDARISEEHKRLMIQWTTKTIDSLSGIRNR